ncbi:MAG: NAD(P)/FAD-dependent oxidoreductase [Thermodesulfobacteriota bacterium]|nr:NAD(P)/FAD-dependent oxidoreductase [Thermodesulfobacteriota bacterium]
MTAKSLSSEYDVVLIGSGHNALCCGAYLAKAGVKVGVFERLPFIGGGCVTVDGEGVEIPGVKGHKIGKTLPGFKHNMHSAIHSWINMGPVHRDLELDKYGARYLFHGRTMAMVYEDGSSLIHWTDLDRTCKEIEKFSRKDAKEYKDWINEYMAVSHLLLAAFYSPPLPDSKMAEMFEGTYEGREMLKIFKSSMRNLILERFESDQLRVLIAVESAQALLQDDVDGTGMIFALLYPVFHMKEEVMGICEGGSGNLSKAMANVITANGGTVVTNAHVENIIVEAGKATGIELSDGTKIKAKQAVASNVEPKQTFLKMVGEEVLEDSFIRQINRWRYDEMVVCTPHLALNEPPRWKAAEKNPEIANTVVIGFGSNTLDDLQEIYNDCRVGRLPDPVGQSVIPTIIDPSQAPPGKHTSLLWAFCSYHLAEGGPQKWDEVKEAYADRCLSEWRKYAPNMTPDNILARYVHSPLDIERDNISMVGGGIMSGSYSTDQMGTYRPFHGYPPYRTPIESLYICGPSAPNGGGCGAAAGYSAAGAIADDLKLKRWWKPMEFNISK